MAAPKSESLEQMQIEFARLMGEQLDQLGFPSGSERAPALCRLLGIPRSQTYRLLRGLAFPSAANMVLLQQAGISIDQALAGLSPEAAAPEVVKIDINGIAVPAYVRLRAEGSEGPLALVRRGKARPAELWASGSGKKLPEQARQVYSITFPVFRNLAIVEDDPATLQSLIEGTRKSFDTYSFDTAMKFLKSDLSSYDLVLLHWSLPDMSGDEVIRRFREASKAPVFILSGDQQASAAIVKAMSDKAVHHVSKPIDLLILLKRLTDAITGRFV